MRVQVRIVAGALRGRKLHCTDSPNLRPTPQMVREALFSILGNAVPGRPFLDLFAGTGVNGLEALSRGATSAVFLERDPRLAADIERHVKGFDLKGKAQVLRSDVYRWASHWHAPPGPVNVFFSPPFADLENRTEAFLRLVADVESRAADDSVLVIQSERGSPLDDAPELAGWERRRYGRNELLIHVKGEEGPGVQGSGAEDEASREEE
jgi:16S rRNA (guanine(966)-N(2))-methyltransferase RsmD